MAFSREIGLATFLAFMDHYECALPLTVKIVDGFCGTNDNDTLDADQICVFYKVERQKVIMAIDEFCQEICVQQNSNSKVYLLPLECDIYTTVHELLTTQSPYILVLEDISVEIVSGSRLKLLSDRRSIPNYLKCQVVDQNDFRDVLLPVHLTGKFLPLLDCKDYFLDEVLSRNQLPINVRFVPETTSASDLVSARSLTNLGSIRLTHKTEVAMVFAVSVDNESSLYMFPETLDITVCKGFKVSAETSKKMKECRTVFETSVTSSKRLDDVVKGSFYFTASPVRRFNLQSLQKTPPILLPRIRKAKHYKIQEENSGRPEEVNTCLAASDTLNEGIHRNSVLPLNRMLSLTGENKVKEAEVHGTSQPVPKPRKRLAAKAGSQEISKDSPVVQTQWQGGHVVKHSEFTYRPRNLWNGRVDEIYPELPPRPIWLQPLSSGNEEEGSPTSQKDSRPPLPPKNGKTNCPEQQHNENDLYLEPITLPPAQSIDNKEEESPTSQEDSAPPLPPKNVEKTYPEQQNNGNNDEEEPITLPAFPPRKKSFIENNLVLAYLVVDVSDWKAVEDNYYGGYAKVKDDGRVLKRNGGRYSYLEVIYQASDTEDNQKPKE